MAFDLNKKGDEKKRFDLSKSNTVASKFDLTKENGDVLLKDGERKKSSLWIFALLGIVALAIGVWYFTPQSRTSNTDSEIAAQTTPVTDKPVSSVSSTDSVASSTSNTTTSELNANTSTNSNPATALNNISAGNNSKSSNNPSSTSLGSSENNTNITSSSLNDKIPASFVSGSSDLNSIDDRIVNDLITYLSQHPQSKVTINGYSSSEGDLSFNSWLSEKRAKAFRDYLIDNGVASEKIVALGKGIQNPVASNDTEEGRIKNRRVEIFID